MFFKKNSCVIFRNYDSFGYITDNRSFGYKKKNNNENPMGDKILSVSGSLFFSILDINPQTLDELAIKINEIFSDVDIETIKNDAKEFYLTLEKDRFVLSGSTSEECKKKDVMFSYEKRDTSTIKENEREPINYPDKSPQDFLKEYFGGHPQLTNVHIEITSKCNERCAHCYIPHENKTDDITPELFYTILEQCYNMKVFHLTISGGEPMLHKNFLDFIKKCKEYNFSVNILSNLTLINDEIIEEMKINPLLGVQTSLYSMDSEVHDGITQHRGSFRKTKNAILKLAKNNIPMQISCPIMKQNKNGYTDVVKWAEKYDISVGDDYVIIGRYDNTIENLNCRLSIEEIKRIISEKAASDTGYLEQIEVESNKKGEVSLEDYVCSVCNSSICIAENGNIYPCAGWQSYIIGNVKETSLNKIWDKSEKILYLRSLRKRDFPQCIQCTDKEFCTMCMVRNANESPIGDPLAVNEYFCEIAKYNKMKVLELKKSMQPSSLHP